MRRVEWTKDTKLGNQPPKQGKLGKMGRKRECWEENGKLARSLPLRTGRAGYGPANHIKGSVPSLDDTW